MYKNKKYLSISDKDKEILTIEIISKESKNMFISCCYRPPKGITENLTAYLASIFQGVRNEKKKIFMIGDFDLNCLNYNEDSMEHFYHKVFEFGFIPLIDKLTRVCKNSETIIDNILTNCVFENTLKKAIIKSDISDHFPIMFTIQTAKNQSKCQDLVYNKREFNEANKAAFKQQLSFLHWRHVNSQKDVNKMYEIFLSIFLEIYETNFSYKQVTVKPQDVKNPWMSKALKKSSIQKQKLYVKYLKQKTTESEKTYKDYKDLFNKLKKNNNS